MRHNEEKYWVFEWLDRHRVSSIEAVSLLLSNPLAVNDLRQGADVAIKQFGAAIPAGESVLVGRGIDLSGQMDCFAPSWRKQQAHRLFSKVWHYFDSVVLEDSIAHELHWHRDETRLPKWLLSHLEILLYLREIGAEPLLKFRPKPPPCQVHLAQHVEEASLTRVMSAESELAGTIVGKAKIVLERQPDGSIDFRIDFDDFVHTQWGTVSEEDAKGLSEDEVKLIAVKQVFAKFLAHLASDVRAARAYKTPLGAAVPFHQALLRRASRPTVADVAMSMQLPVLEGIPPETLLRIREDECEYFHRFRVQLRLAISERLKAAESDDPGRIADEIQRDVIELELNAIRDRLATAERILAKKSAVGIFLGALATTCGLLAGAAPPIALVAGVTGTAAVTGSAASKYLDEIAEVSLKGMYFLWQAEKHI